MAELVESLDGDRTSPNRRWRAVRTSPALIILLLGLACALLLALPGRTVATKSLEELFLAFDGINRILWGQVPNRDFHSSLGPLAYYLPALGFRLSGSYGAALPTAMALLLVCISAIAAHILASRLKPALAVMFAGFLFVILAVPINLGEGVTALSFAMFYNRIGWVALALLLVMYVRPGMPAARQQALDTLCAVLLTLVMVYTKITYGLVAVGFLLLMLTDARQRRWSAMAIALVAACLVAVELFWRGSQAYIADILITAGAGGGLLRGTWSQILDHLLGNFADYVLLSVLVGLALWRRWSFRDLLFFVFCGAAGFWLINHNDQRWGIIAIHAAAVVAAERLLRHFDEREDQADHPLVNRAGVQLYILAFVLPTIVHCAIALGLHTYVAATNSGQQLQIAGFERVEIADLWTPGEFGGANWYLRTIEDGIRVLSGIDPAPQRLVVLPGPNPFSAAMNLEPASGDVTETRWNATMSSIDHVPPEQVFANADIVLERLSGGGAWEVGELYLPYVRQNFQPIAQSENWRVFRRNAPAALEGASPGAASSEPTPE